MIFDVITLFPSMFKSPFSESIIKKAIDSGIVQLRTIDLRGFAEGRHKVTDDSPFGGGCGMVMKPEPIYNALKSINALKCDVDESKEEVILLTPKGELFTQEIAGELSSKERVVMICGRYEGVDERVGQNFVTRQLSIGDYVLTGGEVASMVIIDSVSRLIGGVLGNEYSHKDESHTNGLLEYAQYTRPADFMGLKVPEVLLSGDHKKIEEFRRKDALKKTLKSRPDLIDIEKLSKEDREMLRSIKGQESVD
jgi:tRNA (guanine37-N1)-methyltransferase